MCSSTLFHNGVWCSWWAFFLFSRSQADRSHQLQVYCQKEIAVLTAACKLCFLGWCRLFEQWAYTLNLLETCWWDCCLLWGVAGSNLLHRQMLMLACSREELWIITNHLNSRKDNKVAYNMPSAVVVTVMVAALVMKIRLMGMQPQSAVWQIMPQLLIFTKIPSSQMQLAVSEEAGKAIWAWEKFSKIQLAVPEARKRQIERETVSPKTLSPSSSSSSSPA